MSEELTPMDRMELWMSALNEAITNGTENSFMPYNRYELWMKKLCEAILAKDPADPDVVQAFVEDWLDDHPEATTTVEDGAVTTAKLASAAVTRAKVADAALADIAGEYSSSATYAVGDYVFHSGALYRCVTAITTAEAWTAAHWSQVKLANDVDYFNLTTPLVSNPFSFSIPAIMFESGRLDANGQPATHASQRRTKDFIPVKKGDTIYQTYSSTNIGQINIFSYDASKTYLANSGWMGFNNTVQPYVVSTDGYIKIVYSPSSGTDWTTIGDKVRVVYTAIRIGEENAIERKLQTNIIPIPKENLVIGAWTAVGAITINAARARCINPVHLKEGDEIHFTAKNELLCDIGFKNVLDTVTTATYRGFSNAPFKAPVDGYAYLNFKYADNSAITDFSDFDKVVTIERAYEIGLIENTPSRDLYNGYINSSNSYTISSHSERLVNWNPIHANKGDIVRLNYLDLMFAPYEFDATMQCIEAATSYITPTYVGGSYPLCGDYIVKHDDCWIMCTITSMYGVTHDSFKPEDFPNAISVIHVDKNNNRNLNTAEDTRIRFPKSARKPIPFSTEAVVSQGATIINGKLWAAVEVSGGDDYIQVINLETGAIEKSITHDLGHCNCLDYCAETDTLMTVDSTDYKTILLLPNVSDVTTSISKSDCISIEVDDIDFFGTCCFGQDHREVIFYCGVGSDTRYNLYKGVLGYDDGEYDGTVEITKQYSGVIRDNIDTYVTAGTTGYAQDSCYDGYYYLAYGTSGHNFLVIDIDDKEETYKVVGNYLHHEYKDDYTEYGVEPEGVAIYDNKIYCLSRQNTIHASYFNVFYL